MQKLVATTQAVKHVNYHSWLPLEILYGNHTKCGLVAAYWYLLPYEVWHTSYGSRYQYAATTRVV